MQPKTRVEMVYCTGRDVIELAECAIRRSICVASVRIWCFEVMPKRELFLCPSADLWKDS